LETSSSTFRSASQLARLNVDDHRTTTAELLQHPTDRSSASRPPNAPLRLFDHAGIHPLLVSS
jgi:hypothetical protein